MVTASVTAPVDAVITSETSVNFYESTRRDKRRHTSSYLPPRESEIYRKNRLVTMKTAENKHTFFIRLLRFGLWITCAFVTRSHVGILEGKSKKKKAEMEDRW
jgi:hypothetical protein